jgi:hypothetical protein
VNDENHERALRVEEAHERDEDRRRVPQRVLPALALAMVVAMLGSVPAKGRP